eukprot:Platyproteum_vivax@DN2488_c0_g1_i2.p1
MKQMSSHTTINRECSVLNENLKHLNPKNLAKPYSKTQTTKISNSIEAYKSSKQACVNDVLVKDADLKGTKFSQDKNKRRILGDIGNQQTLVVSCNEKYTSKPEKETDLEASSFSAVESISRCEADADVSILSDLSEVDEENRFVAAYAAPYVRRIVAHLYNTESMTGENLMESQEDVTERMRSVLVDWLVEVHHRFKLSQQTLFLAVNYLDRFITLKTIAKSKLQLLGVTCLWIASKFEEIYQPEIRNFEFVTSRACTRDNLIAMETEVLNELHFNLCVPTPVCFLSRLLQVAGIEPKTLVGHMASFFLECTLGNTTFSKYKPSLLAATCVYLAKKACRMTPCWTARLERHTGYQQLQHIRAPAKLLCGIVNDLHGSPYQAVRIKYSSDRYKAVAKEVVVGAVPAASTAGRPK